MSALCIVHLPAAVGECARPVHEMDGPPRALGTDEHIRQQEG